MTNRLHLGTRCACARLYVADAVLGQPVPPFVDAASAPDSGIPVGAGDYDVALVEGGYAVVRGGVLQGWAPEAGAALVLSVYGDVFDAAFWDESSPERTYLLRSVTPWAAEREAVLADLFPHADAVAGADPAELAADVCEACASLR